MGHTEYLAHHGIQGQKWGVRRFQNKDGSLTAAGKKRRNIPTFHEDYSKAHTYNSVRTMSDKELRDRLNRLDMEKRYKDLMRRKPIVGEKFVKDVIKNAGKQVATEYVAKYMKKKISSFFDETDD